MNYKLFFLKINEKKFQNYLFFKINCLKFAASNK